jgi:hypothetical protein
MIQASGNHDMLNLAQGGRRAGFQAVIPQEGDYTQTASVPGELVSRYIFGRTGRLLPWEQFTAERPEISPDDYQAYRAHQFDGGLFDIGLIKGTGRNLEGEPEFTMMGFRAPLSAIGTSLGAMGGGIAGAQIAAKQLTENPDLLPVISRKQGPMRVAGAAAGALLGAIAGNLGTRATNALVIQPAINPERVQAQRAWEQQQNALGLI